jgi:hypothetical protein
MEFGTVIWVPNWSGRKQLNLSNSRTVPSNLPSPTVGRLTMESVVEETGDSMQGANCGSGS